MNSIFSGIEKLSLLDYDGYISCVLFVAGCNMRCPYCHNGALLADIPHFLTDEEIFEFLSKKTKLIDAVVISGGEPTLYDAQLANYIQKIKSYGYKIKLDTNGTNPAILQKLINKNLLDYIAMDIKNSEEKYASTAALPSININDIKKSINIIINSNIDYEFRTTITELLHNSDDISSIAIMIKGAKKYYLQKFIDRDGCLSHTHTAVSIYEARQFMQILNDSKINTSLRGYD